MATYVLVHGGWSGAHGFRHVRRLLQGAGHEVFTPSLTGIGERVHLASPQVDLTTHISRCRERGALRGPRPDRAARLLLRRRSRDRCASPSSRIGYASSCTSTRSCLRTATPCWDLAGRDGEPAITLGEDWLVPPMPRQYDDPDEGAWQQARRVSHPVRCFTEPVRLDKPLEDNEFGLTYIKATNDPSEAPGQTRSGKRAGTRSRRRDGRTTRSRPTTWS